MTKKRIVITGVIVTILIIGAAGFFLLKSIPMAAIERDYSEPQDNRGTITFKGKEGEVLTFQFSSDIEEGTVQFFLLDSDENVLAACGQDIAEQEIELEKDDMYELAAVSEALVGKYKLRVYRK